jgi:hypothetical protein
MAKDLNFLVADAIKSADTSWFNEDYTRQAKAVLAALHKAGYRVVPKDVPEALVPFVEDNMPFGRLKPSELIRELYGIMIENAARFRKP